jgi:putative lipoic acid-binding regulatory protein
LISPTDSNELPLYPAECHFRIIGEAGADPSAALAALLEGYEVTSPLGAGNRSRSGRYQAFEVSARVGSREEMEALDRAIRAVPGVKMLL